MGDIPKNANTQADPRMTDLLDVSPDTFDILGYIVWEQYMTAKAELAWAIYEHALRPDQETTASDLAEATDIFVHTEARLQFLNNWELDNLASSD